MRIADVKGERFGSLVAVERRRSVGGSYTWLCQCDCGNQKVISLPALRKGTNSCGCIRKKGSGGVPTHGHTMNDKMTREYRAWILMKSRCLNERHDRYKYYGGRGIKVHQPWADGFEIFLEDMGRCQKGRYLLRRDKDGDYTPHNCYWGSPAKKNVGSKRNSHTPKIRKASERHTSARIVSLAPAYPTSSVTLE